MNGAEGWWYTAVTKTIIFDITAEETCGHIKLFNLHIYTETKDF